MTTAATSVRTYYRFFKKQGVQSVLDYGAGTLRNSCFLAEHGFAVYAADIPEQVERILRMATRTVLAGVVTDAELERSRLDADLVLSTYVLNIIPDGTEKARYIRNITLNLRAGGYLLVEARCRREDAACGSGCSSHAKCPSCVKTYSHGELDRLLSPFGFRRVCHYYRRHAVAVLYQKNDG
ncbi:MAG TPA: methyltransferase domain-containing protein [Geobacteraceae bacterium]